MHIARRELNKAKTPLLYFVVFKAAYTRWLIAFLLLFFLLHPAVPVFAADEEVSEAAEVLPEPEVDVSEPIADEIEEVVESEPEEEIEMVDNEVEDADQGVGDEETLVEIPNGEIDTTDHESEIVSESFDSGDSTIPIVTEPSTSTVSISPDTDMTVSSTSPLATSTNPSQTDDTPEVEGVSTSTPGSAVVPVNTATSSASTTEQQQEGDTEDSLIDDVISDTELPPEVVEPEATKATSSATTSPQVQIVYVDRLLDDPSIKYFDSENCSPVGDGSFYCAEATYETASVESDGVFVAPDSDGDLEIFLKFNNDDLQITDNVFDDSAPDFDSKTNTVVWHQLREGLYQIRSYNIETEEEVLVSSGETNNMEPAHENGVTVWQRWIEGNWEIMMSDGKKETQLTDNNTHDVAPDIRNGFVMWNTTGANGQKEVSVYEIETGLLSTIADSDGGQVQNPRFVLVYDTKFANGDIITKGYNPETGEVEPLSATPADVPQEIPESDQTGETRALIQNKTTTGRDSFDSDSDDATGPDPATDPDNSVASSTASSATSTADIVDLDLSTTTPEILPLDDFDLIVEPYSSTTSSQLNDSASTTNPVE